MILRKKIDTILGNTLVVIMTVMVINVLWQVFTRYILGIPSSFTDELARYLMIWLGILGAAYVSGQNLHVAIDVLPSKLGKSAQNKMARMVNMIIIVFAITALIIGGIRLVYITYLLGQHSPALEIPLAVVYLVLPLSGLLIIFYKVSDFLTK